MDVETARRILGRVSYGQRFPIGRLVPPVGLLASSVRGLEELALALRPEPRSLAGANLARLADWIEQDVGDPACAADVRLAADAAPSYVEACQAIHQRVAERVEAARALLEAAESDSQQAGNHGRV
ncbi:MAG TPA: hypothetical protein VLN08_08985 [Vicinamibacterales bacterium]|nr:hypothetical protein [Vicinamibacterales bacterium]